MQETEKYKLKKPSTEDFFNIEDFNENTDKIEQALKENAERVEELKAPSFDDSGTVDGINSFTDFLNSVKNKMNIFQFFKNFKAGMKFILHTGMIVDNYATKEKGFIPDATLVTSLKEQLDEQNNNITRNYWCFYNGTLIKKQTDLNSLLDFGNYYCQANSDTITLINSPTNQAFILKVYSGNGSSKSYVVQELTTHNEGVKYIRCCNKDTLTWTGWKRFLTNSDLTVFESACTIPSSIDLYVSQNLVEKSANTVCLTLDFHTNKTIESGSIIFVLPEGFRPRKNIFVPVLDVTTNVQNTYATIEPNGNISVASSIQTGFFNIIQKTFMCS